MAISRYGGGTGPIHYENIFRTGNETRLLDCAVADLTICSHIEDAGVKCPSGEQLVFAVTVLLDYSRMTIICT